MRLGEQAFRALLLFLDVMLDQLREHRDLRVVEFLVGLAVELGDQHLGAVMLDIGFVEQVVVLDLALAGRIEDLLLDRRVDA